MRLYLAPALVPRNALLATACVTAISVLSGCGDALGPEKMETTSISGRIHVSGVPLTKGWIEFMPSDGTIGLSRSALIHADGTFAVTRVPVGSVRIHLAGPSPQNTGDSLTNWYIVQTRASYTTQLKIKSGINPPFDLDLRREAAKLDRTQREKQNAGAKAGS